MSLLEQTERELALTEEIAHKFDIKGAERAGTERFFSAPRNDLAQAFIRGELVR